MSRLFARLGSAFVAPPARGGEACDEVRRREVAAEARSDSVRAAAPPNVAILCRPDDALVAGGAVAIALAGRSRASNALVAAWAAEGSARSPAGAASRRLASALGARGHDAMASGRLAVVRLAADLSAAAAEAVRAAAAAPAIPVVTVLAGPRDEAADPLLRTQDAILVALPAEGDAAVTDLALRGVAPLGVPARALRLPPSPAAVRALASSGVALLPPLRGAVESALGEVG